MITMMTKNLHDYDDYDHDLNESEEDTRWAGYRHLMIIIQSTTIVITMIIQMIAPMTLVSTQVTEEGSVAAAATALLG